MSVFGPPLIQPGDSLLSFRIFFRLAGNSFLFYTDSYRVLIPTCSACIAIYICSFQFYKEKELQVATELSRASRGSQKDYWKTVE